MSTEHIIEIKSQAQANQLVSLMDTHNCVQLRTDWGEPFKVGATAVVWTFSSNLHYTQYTVRATDDTLAHLVNRERSSVNELATDLIELG